MKRLFLLAALLSCVVSYAEYSSVTVSPYYAPGTVSSQLSPFQVDVVHKTTDLNAFIGSSFSTNHSSYCGIAGSIEDVTCPVSGRLRYIEVYVHFPFVDGTQAEVTNKYVVGNGNTFARTVNEIIPFAGRTKSVLADYQSWVDSSFLPTNSIDYMSMQPSMCSPYVSVVKCISSPVVIGRKFNYDTSRLLGKIGTVQSVGGNLEIQYTESVTNKLFTAPITKNSQLKTVILGDLVSIGKWDLTTASSKPMMSSVFDTFMTGMFSAMTDGVMIDHMYYRSTPKSEVIAVDVPVMKGDVIRSASYGVCAIRYIIEH